MDIKVTRKSLAGEVTAISSKAQAHRILIAAALSDDLSDDLSSVVISDTSDDIDATRDCLLSLGEELQVFNCQESGSTLRFLMPLAMVKGKKAVFTGIGGLPNRPLSPLKEQLEEHGCVFSVSGDEICTIEGSLTGGKYILPGNVGSQFVTGLLFALPLLKESSEILLTTPMQSADYVTMTLQVLEMFGVRVEVHYEDSFDEAYSAFRIKGNQKYISPGSITIEGDWSNAAFWLAAGIISPDPDTSVTCRGLNLFSSQGDRKITSIIKAFGGNISKSNVDVTATPGSLRGIEIDAASIPDMIPVISVIASVSQGVTNIINAERLRIRESDRLHAIFNSLTGLGADIKELEGGLIITGKKSLKGGVVSGEGDHRIVMSAAIAAMCCDEPVIITGAEAISKSYPHFFDDFRKLGGEAVVI